MILYSKTATNFLKTLLLLSAICLGSSVFAQDGKALFNSNCASCHAINKKLTGPPLADFTKRGPWGDRKEVYKWVHNPLSYIEKDAYTQALKDEYNGIIMTPFPNLSEKEIDAIVDYIDKAAAAASQPAAGGGAVTAVQPESDNTLLYGILTLILAVIALILLQVNSNLRKLADDKEGVPSHEPVPFYRNKAYIALLTIILFLAGGYLTTKGAIGLGRNTNYQPEQPIYYSHKVHAGVNQISCLYCHTGAAQGKQANIPSVNVCMNCHMAINEYTGEPLYDEHGKEVNGTAEIQKLYKYANFKEGSNANTWTMDDAQPIEWVRIHSLPDHVYFNHSQHVVAGQIACQTCHGEIQKMDEVKQVNDLSMGWCINCHRETQVQFKENGFYSIYEKYHEELKNGKMDPKKGVTVEHIGGTECQKCHY